LAEFTGGVQGSTLHPNGLANSSVIFKAIAADASGNLWIADQHNHGVWEYTPSTTTWTPSSNVPFPNVAALNNTSRPGGIAIDGAGHKWITNESALTPPPLASSITELSADGSTNLSPADGFGSGSINGAYSIAIDGSGNIWVTDGGTTVTQFVGAAAPTRNPIVSAVTSGFTP
jgi:streptogramin lyase